MRTARAQVILSVENGNLFSDCVEFKHCCWPVGEGVVPWSAAKRGGGPPAGQ